MPDLTCSMQDAVQFLIARNISKQKGREWPWPAGHFLNVLEEKLRPEVEQYEKGRTAKCEALADKNEDGTVKRHENGDYVMTDEARATLVAALTPLLAETLTVLNVRKVKASQLAGIPLTDVEAQFIAFAVDDDL